MIAYPAHFEPAEEGGFVVTFPDFGYGVTQGDSEVEAAEMASDLLGCLLSDFIGQGKPLPEASVHRGSRFRVIHLTAQAGLKALPGTIWPVRAPFAGISKRATHFA